MQQAAMEDVAFKSNERPWLFPPIAQIFQANSGPPLEATSHESVPTICSPTPCGSVDYDIHANHPGHKGLGYFSAFNGSLPISRSRSL